MRARVTLQLPRAPRDPLGLEPPGWRVLFLGEGYVAARLRPRLEALGARVEASGRDGPMALERPALHRAFARATHVLCSIPPGRAGDGLDPALRALEGSHTGARFVGYLSATSVYGDRAGGWAFEGEAPTPGLARGRARAAAEIAWLERHPQTELFRLAGIYGPGRAPFSRLRNGTARVVDAPGHVVNRIHVDDIVGALLLAMGRPCAGDILNLADGAPAPPGDVLDCAARLLKVDPPPRVALHDASVSDMARSFYAESKRVDVRRARERLGWEPRYAGYARGLAATLAQDA